MVFLLLEILILHSEDLPQGPLDSLMELLMFSSVLIAFQKFFSRNFPKFSSKNPPKVPCLNSTEVPFEIFQKFLLEISMNSF